VKYDSNVAYGVWLETARLYELSVARQRVAKGEDVDVVMNDMSRKLTNKMTFPLIKIVKEKDK
jgi:glutamyl-tRNA reductase